MPKLKLNLLPWIYNTDHWNYCYCLNICLQHQFIILGFVSHSSEFMHAFIYKYFYWNTQPYGDAQCIKLYNSNGFWNHARQSAQWSALCRNISEVNLFAFLQTVLWRFLLNRLNNTECIKLNIKLKQKHMYIHKDVCVISDLIFVKLLNVLQKDFQNAN